MTSLFKLYNSLTRQEAVFPSPEEKPEVRLYVCGPTVYDDAHLGHARCYITWDVLVRFMRFLGYNLIYARNVTDVDDKILNRAKEKSTTPKEIAEKYYASFSEDMAALNVLTPNHEPRATDYIDEMLIGISSLIENGFAYPTSDGTVYYRVAKKTDYGKLSAKPLDDLMSGARVEVDPEKESPLDFALWKGVADPDDLNTWDTPWGKGRPGWHMECSAMNHGIFGDQIDIHAGGADLVFPHHENEIAQSEAWTGKTPFSEFWLHNGFVNVSGEKMSKSLGNFATIKTMMARYDANTIRYFLLLNGYRMPVDFNDDALVSAENWLKARSKILKNALAVSGCDIETLRQEVPGTLAHAKVSGAIEEFAAVMKQDLNTPRALSIVNSVFDALKDACGKQDAVATKQALSDAVTLLCHLGFRPENMTAEESRELPVEALQTIYKELTGSWLEADKPAETVLAEIIALRQKAKELKNWTQADAIRKHLTDIGIQLKDVKDGPTSWEFIGI